MVQIKRLIIKNFRSIVSADIALDGLNVFVGHNDQGKSNVLRALNLFFNQAGDWNGRFIFEKEFSLYAKTPDNKAKEITIELVFHAPENYAVNGDIHWRKKWRRNGLHDEKIQVSGKHDLPPRSKVESLLRNLRYYYVPAIKSQEFFSDLLGTVHDLLAETVEERMRKASKEFTKTIREYTEDIITDIRDQFGFDTSLELPTDLRELFRTLDFLSSSKERPTQISLQQRGDGIKVRHIPIILKWFGKQINTNQNRGSTPSYSIWGYEEPENNLELSYCIKLADEFIKYSNEAQILITTHSPAFYRLGQQKKAVYVIHKEKHGPTLVKNSEKDSINELDSELGLLPFIVPYLDRAQKDMQELKERLQELESQNQSTLFVEGRDDEKIIKRAFYVLRGNLPNFRICGPSEDCCLKGVDWVKDSLIAWAHLRKQSAVVGLFDSDSAGRRACSVVSRHEHVSRVSKIVRPMVISAPSHITEINKKGINVSFDIEDIFPPQVRLVAQDNGWLEEQSAEEVTALNPTRSLKKSFADFCVEKNLTPLECSYTLERIKDDKKTAFSDFVCSLENEEAKVAFTCFLPIVEKIERALCP